MQTHFRPIVVILGLLLLCVSMARGGDLIPMPVDVKPGTGSFLITAETRILWSGEGSKATADFLSSALKERTGLELIVAEKAVGTPGADAISLTKSDETNQLDGSYEMAVSSAQIAISTASDDGVFYGAMSLLQLADGKPVSVPAMTVSDHPRYAWRGMMIDESRHFFGKKVMMQVLDTMAYLKMNRFHWHLTDEDAWRIEIKKYPKLQTIGATGNRSDPDAAPVFYTQDEIKEVVAYATARHIIVIPEIDMPGHMAAVSRAYPELSGGGRGFTINPGKEESYTFCTDVLTEILPLFPGPYLHIGGDEVAFGSAMWDKDPEIVKFAHDHGLTATKDLEKYFVNRMAGVVHKLGKTLVAWDDAVVGVDNKDTILMWWHDKHPETMLQNDYQVVLCPHVVTYFNSRQEASHQVLKNRPVTDLTVVYKFPESATDGMIPAGKEGNVLGVQACLWTEYVGDAHRFDYMMYPRLAAFAEDAWTRPQLKHYDDFMKRLPSFLKELDRQGVNYYNPFDSSKTPEPAPPVITRYVPRGRADKPTTAP